MQSIDAVTTIVADTLGLGSRGNLLQPEAALLGAVPELDSMAVVHIIAALEEHFEISIDDDDISARTFATLNSLAAFVDQKLAQ